MGIEFWRPVGETFCSYLGCREHVATTCLLSVQEEARLLEFLYPVARMDITSSAYFRLRARRAWLEARDKMVEENLDSLRVKFQLEVRL
jgi:hypothetical protein